MPALDGACNCKYCMRFKNWRVLLSHPAPGIPQSKASPIEEPGCTTARPELLPMSADQEPGDSSGSEMSLGAELSLDSELQVRRPAMMQWKEAGACRTPAAR